MKFINKNVITFGVIAAALTITFFLVLSSFIEEGNGKMIIITSISYGFSMFLNGLFCGKNDIYGGYYGFNYALVTYVIGCTVPFIMSYSGYILESFIATSVSMYLYWGMGVLLHALAYFYLRNKRSIKGFDKDEIFN